MFTRNALKALTSAAAIWLASFSPLAAAELTGDAMLTALKDGGYVVYFRHAISDTTQNDADPIKVDDCSTQRNLSDAGRAQSKKLGSAFQLLGIKVDKVMASPYCRAKETAKTAFDKVEPVGALFYSLGLGKDEAAKAGADLKKILATAPAAGANTVLVGHTSNLKEVAGVWPKKEGGAYVFRPDGSGGFKLVGLFEPSDYEKKAGS